MPCSNVCCAVRTSKQNRWNCCQSRVFRFCLKALNHRINIFITDVSVPTFQSRFAFETEKNPSELCWSMHSLDLWNGKSSDSTLTLNCRKKLRLELMIRMCVCCFNASMDLLNQMIILLFHTLPNVIKYWIQAIGILTLKSCSR